MPWMYHQEFEAVGDGVLCGVPEAAADAVCARAREARRAAHSSRSARREEALPRAPRARMVMAQRSLAARRHRNSWCSKARVRAVHMR